MKIRVGLVEYIPTNFLEVEDKHYPELDAEWTLDNQRVDDSIWKSFIEFVKQHLSIIEQKTIDKRQTLQTAYQLDGYGIRNVTIFIEENDNCSSITSPLGWIIIRMLEEFNDWKEPTNQCIFTYTEKDIQLRCLRELGHDGVCRFAN